jgi:hypothetical protein
MNRLNPITLTLASAGLAFFIAAGGCGGGDDHDHANGAHDHGDDHADAAGGHHGDLVDLGEISVAGMTVKASTDFKVEAGGDVPVDIWIDGGLGGASTVRFWIGTEDAKGSIKAKAEVEDGKWHTHAEAPVPLPAGSKLWVEIEKSGERQVVGFDLKG